MFDKTSQSQQPEAQPPETVGGVMTEERQQGEPSGQAPESGETEAWKEKYQLLQDQFTRLAADFDNFRKRTREEQEQIARYGAQKTATELLPVFDNLERATASLSENSDPKVLYKSFNLVHKQLMDGLASLGIQKIQAVGQPFDPMFHEAVNRMPSNEFPENTVMYEAQSGYMLHDKVLRPAMVVVSTGVGEESAVSDASSAPAASAPAAEPQPTIEEDRSNPFRR
ncbi:MAG TPA: nucleotide exchange factor GrpE [Coleofasciculaceae cyanobacterium]|jgi:molecular chaperone GrpE